MKSIVYIYVLLTIVPIVTISPCFSAQTTQPQGQAKEPKRDEQPVKSIDELNKKLMKAFAQKKQNKYEALIEQGADVNAIIGSRTMLHVAVSNGDEEGVSLLLDNGALIDAKDSFGLTPLHYAVAGGHGDIVEILLEHNAEVDIKDNAGRTALHYVSGAVPVPKNPSQDAINVNTARLLLDSGADVNTQDDLGMTPLHYAAFRGQKAIAEILMSNNADIYVTDNRGRTAYSIAQYGITSVERLLDSPIRTAAEEYIIAHEEITELLRKDYNVYFVAPEGDDNNPGTQQSPFGTIGAAVDTVKPGDIIFIRGGSYSCAHNICLDKSGELGRPIRLSAYAHERPILDFSSAKGSAIEISGAYWHLKGLAVAGAEHSGIFVAGSSAHHNVLEEMSTYNCFQFGIDLEYSTTYNLVLDCDAYLNFDRSTNGEDGDGFVSQYFIGEGNVFIGNRSWNNSDDGYDCWRAGEAVRFERCYAWRNGENIWNHPLFTGNGNGFKLGQGKGRHVLINCFAWENPNRGFDLNGNTQGVTIRKCTGWSNGCNYFFNDDKGAPGNALHHNISYRVRAYGGRDRIGAEVDSQANSWDAKPAIALTDTDFLSLDDSQMSAPRNTDGSIPYSDFLRLAPGSAAIDAGTDVNMPYVGKAPDLGAFEYDPNENPENYVKMLHQYVRDHDTKKINELLAAGTSINEKDWLGYAPLHWACYFGYADLAELLIGKGADPSLVSDTGRTPLEIATSMQYDNIADLLRQHGAKK
jgi:ankyrin repeat protein